MPVAAPAEGYLKMIAYGQNKSALRLDQLALQSCLAGFWVAVFGHACTVFASTWFDPENPASTVGMTRLAYGALFPGAFVAVVYTGTELFTGNTVTMIMYAFNEGKSALWPMARVWLFSFVGNYVGAVLGALILTFASGVFSDGSREQAFLFSLTSSKVHHGFGENIVLGFGCNALVCLATWCVVVTDDGAGKILAMFYAIGVFAMGGFEHIVANFYTLTAGVMCGFDEAGYGEIITRNFIPVTIGNFLAGTLFTGVMWWYALHPQYTDLAPYSNQELLQEVARRAGSISSTVVLGPEGELEPDGVRWQPNRSYLSATRTSASFLLTPHHLFPVGQQPTAGRDLSYIIGQPPHDNRPAPERKPSSTATPQPPGQPGPSV